MTSTQIITNTIFMDGYRRILMGLGDDRVEVRLRSAVGQLFDEDAAMLPFLSESMEVFSNGIFPMHVIVSQGEDAVPTVYRFLPLGENNWMPVDEKQVQINFTDKTVPFCVPAVMAE